MTNQNKYLTTTSILSGLTLLSGAYLASPHVMAANNGAASITVEVPSVCDLSISNSSHSVSITPGQNLAIGTATLTTLCNDGNGHSVYMVGYTGDTIGATNSTKLVSTNSTIATGTATSGTTSNWGVTINAVTGTYAPSITSGWANTLKAIPASYTKIATLSGTTDQSTGSKFTAAFSAFVAPSQAAGSYTGKVKFTMVHPANATAPTT